jgi:undecaprenyl diphosphate synthase
MKKNIPTHVGIIMDGNRRWARNNNVPLFMGHREGAKKIEPLVDEAIKKGINYVTFWAFSTENWKRDKNEIEVLFKVFRLFLHSSFMKKLKKKQVRVSVIGDMSPFPKDIQKDVEKIIEESKQFTAITVNFALNYGGRAEILQAVQKALTQGSHLVTEEEFGSYLYTVSQPDPDLIIRTGGDKRLSGFFPWQSTYSELYFTKTLWPDFNEAAFEKAIKEYQNRQRRFGK